MNNRICDLLKIKYPIIQGAMHWLSVPELASAVSNSGGLGTITAASFSSKENLKEQIRKMKSLTNNPFSVNITLFSNPTNKETIERYIEATIEEEVKVVETSGKNPEKYIPILKEAGITVIHKATSVKHAKKAEKIGADAVTIVGYECGGHPGMNDTTTMVLIQRASQELSIPIIAGGGIFDSRGFIAALVLGADAIVMGTRFIASEECLIHNNFKELILKSNESDTVIIERSINNAMRAIKNSAAEKVIEMEEKGADLQQLMTVISGKITKECYKNGNIDGCIFPLGQISGLINNVKTVSEIIEEIIGNADSTLNLVKSKISM